MRKRILLIFIVLAPAIVFAQNLRDELLDSLRFVDDMPYICHGTEAVGCGSRVFWNVVKERERIVPGLIGKLTDTTSTLTHVPNFGGLYTVADVAYDALTEIVHSIPTFELLGVPFDEHGCGYCSYWNHLRKDIRNREAFQRRVKSWYEKNRSKLIWVKSEAYNGCDCASPHPNGGHFERLKN